MVNLSLDPPPFGSSHDSGGGFGRYLAYLIVLAVGLAGGFVAGRKTAPHAPPPTAVHPVAPASAVSPAAPGMSGGVVAATSTVAAPVTSPVPAPATGAAALAPAGLPAASTAVPSLAPPSIPASSPQGPFLRRIAVTLRGPLEDSVSAALPPGERAWAEQLTQVVNRILVWSLRISRDARRGDQLEVLYELPTLQPSAVVAVGDTGPAGKEPVVLALRYGSQKLGRLITAYRFKPESAPFARYYTSEGVEVEDHLLEGPVSDYEQVTSLLRDGRRHKGVDFKTPVGTPVRSPFDGQITRRNWHFGVNGNCIEVVDAKTGRHAIFLHLESVPKEMQPGRKVARGEVVARSGNSGHSTAPHLHYQLEAPDGRILDPFAVMATKKVALEGSAKAAFEGERSRLDPTPVAGR
jgi:hypothetical protein